MDDTDFIGKRFDRLTVVGVYDKKNNMKRWACKCDCGNIIPVYKANLLRKSGKIKSCGCAYLDELKKEIGRKKDKLEIIGAKQYSRGGKVIVKCQCGKIKEMTLSEFNNPLVHSCGCSKNPTGENRKSYKHGMSKEKIYTIYRDIYNRCYNIKDISYSAYGARGIKMCDEWLGENGLEIFADWAYENGYDEAAKRGQCTIDRIDVNGNYEPSNCRFVSMKIQSNNKTNNSYYEIDGVVKTLTEWCEEYNIKCMNSVRCRIKRGMDIKTALTKPMQKKVKDMTLEELEERKIKRLEKDRKWREEHKEQVRKSREKWIKNNPDKNKESKRKYEEKIKKLKQI